MGGGQSRDIFRGGPVKKTTLYVRMSFTSHVRLAIMWSFQVIWDEKSSLYPALGTTYHCGLQDRFDLIIVDLGSTGVSHPQTRFVK